ncbi:MAG TPA: lipid-A-disaccharide synthase [Caulobacteraceae bacterium]|nr:lipid-A-disaccharide synthase [Caulobacteraceae bacterium]
MSAPCVMLVAVEPSGDSLGAALAAALRERLGPGLRLVGVGGPAMAAQGIASPFDPSSLAVVGVFNAVAAYPEVLRRADQAAAIAVSEKPDAAILIDAWGFNLRVAHRLRRLDPALPLIKYVAPQVWATRPGRARTLARAVDRLLTIHSFDAPWFEAEGLPTTFVGNPALNRDFSAADPEGFRAAIGAGPGDPILLVLPGSRAGEVDRLTPVFGEAVRRLTAGRPDLRVALGVAEGMADRVKPRLATWSRRPFLVEGETDRLSAMRAATAALACSGTVTTELALAGCPMVVAYKLGPLTHPVAKVLIRTRYITLFNVAAQAFVAPERVQGACRSDVLAADLARMLDDPAARAAQVAAQAAALEIMRGGVADPIGAAADAVVAVLTRGSR